MPDNVYPVYLLYLFSTFLSSDWAKGGWTIDCSGHSLGGALASLMAHNIAHNYPEVGGKVAQREILEIGLDSADSHHGWISSRRVKGNERKSESA